MLALLAALATLQYVWLGRLSNAERGRLRAGLDHAAARFCDDVDRELVRAFLTFMPALRPEGGQLTERLVRQARRWRADAPYPELVESVALVRPRDGGGMAVECLDWATFSFRPCPWPAAFDPVREAVETGQPIRPFPDDVPGFVLEPRRFGRPEPEDGRRRPVSEPRFPRILITLDETFVATQMLPRLASVYFAGGSGLDYSVVVVGRGEPGRVLFHSGPETGSTDPVGKDVVRAFFTLRSFRGPVADTLERSAGGREELPPGTGPGHPTGGDPRDRDDDAGRAGIHGSGRWLLLVNHPAGSLDAAVEQARLRNLGIGLSVLALLAGSAILLVVSSQRAQRLARQQLDFVAAVSHELRTPLTALCSAGENLADGVVVEGDQVRRYGAMIASEGRRLTEIVTRVLDFAGIRSGQRSYQFQPVAIGALVSSVLEASRHRLEARGIRIEAEVAPDLPPLAGDAGALGQVLHNLIDNAAKFGGAAHWVGVQVATAEGTHGPELSVAVSDHGPGIRRADLGRIFEPFERGSNPSVATVPGSGLGLALVRHIVEAHGGRVLVRSTVGEGTTFDVRLPVASDRRRSRP